MEFDPLLSLALTLGVGRLCLSALPPGWPGDHNRLELGATLCASWLLGSTALAVAPWLWLWAGLALVRVATLPGAMRPRHERARDVQWLWLAASALFMGTHWLGGNERIAALGLCAALFVVIGWRTWERRADRRARLLALGSWLAPLFVYLCA